MAEFGENIRKAREKLGITQQTLADKLYVTRQAVSRWENGSRYPDLLTAKSLAKALDTNLDELLRDDDMRTYPEVNPVLEYPLHKRIQTALFAAAFVTNMVEALWSVFYIITENRYMREWESAAQYSSAVANVLVSAILFYGMIKSIKDSIDPRVVMRLAAFTVATDMVHILIYMYLILHSGLRTSYDFAFYIICLTADVAFILSVILYYLVKKQISPIPVYLFLGVTICYDLYVYISDLIDLMGDAIFSRILITSTLGTFATLLVRILFIYMTAVLHRKRRIAEIS